MLEKLKQELSRRLSDEQLIENLFFSYQRISEKFIAQKPVDLLQNTGLFVESALRVAEHFILGAHTSLGKEFDIDNCIQKLEKSSGADGLRIHVARLSRAIYDFRSRKKGVHLKAIDPMIIDASVVFNICTWIFIEILKESGVSDAEKTIHLLFTRKTPLVQEVDGILRTTNPKLSGTQRILILLYSAPNGLFEAEILEGAKRKVKNKDHLHKDLKSMDTRDLIHQRSDSKWTLFGQGFGEAEKLISKYS
ncbi:MAG: hypothetical protein WCT08_04205 [Patescibacteria group bacterium]|jgi:hypothetical protein